MFKNVGFEFELISKRRTQAKTSGGPPIPFCVLCMCMPADVCVIVYVFLFMCMFGIALSGEGRSER